MATAALSLAHRPSRTERNASACAAGAAQVAATCPWAPSDGAETASTASSRQPSSRNTCPWAPVEVLPPKPRRAHQTVDTCPWGSQANDKDTARPDMHTARLADAARRRQRPSPKNYGAAGSGAPKLPALVGEGLSVQGFPPAREEAAEAIATQKPPTFLETLEPGAAGTEFLPGPEDEDEEQREQREIIQQCLAEGLGEDRILEILDEWANEKLVRRTQDRMDPAPQRANAVPVVTDQTKMRTSGASAQGDTTSQGTGSSPAGSCSSLAASRQAKAKKSLSFGPSDAEVVDILKDYAKENLTPPESALNSPSNALSLAAKRKKDKEPSEASVGSFDSDKARAAYFQSRSQMDKMKNQNRVSSRIF